MKYRRLGDAGTKVSAVSLGGWINFEGAGKLSADAARSTVEKAYELGINFFDLADVYGNGKAEKQMGDILKQFPRHTLVISTKVFWPMSEDINDRGLSRKHIHESIDASLERLGTDYVDIYFCHRADSETPILETAWAMHDLIQRGKVLYWATSEWSGAQIAEAVAVCEEHGLHKPQVDQPNYSLLHRSILETSVAPVAIKNGIGLTVFSPLAMGMLTGKYDDGIPADSRFAREEWAKAQIINDHNVQNVRQLKSIADGLGITRAQLALAWILHQPGISSVITGATRPAQVEDNVKAVDVTLSEDVLKQINALFPA